MILSRSADPTKRMAEDTYFDGQPLRHRTVTYNKGSQGTFKTEAPRIDWGR
jgi:hypothetical protein